MHFAAQPVLFIAALVLAAIVGFANQQGGTCTVAAVEDLLRRREPGRMIALAECSLWAFALALALELAGLQDRTADNAQVGLISLAGGALLGLGAWLNKACLFGTLARIGNRDVNYIFTLAGLLAGFSIHAWLFQPAVIAVGAYEPGVISQVGVAGLFCASLLVRGGRFFGRVRTGAGAALRWSYHEATIVHVVAFMLLASIAGPWTYSEALSRYAHQHTSPQAMQWLLFAATFVGAGYGGWRTAKRTGLAHDKAPACFLGGVLMALGAALAHGGNDSLFLNGLPLLQGHAIVSLTAMLATIAACSQLRHAISG